jgi:hypothetical protein
MLVGSLIGDRLLLRHLRPDAILFINVLGNYTQCHCIVIFAVQGFWSIWNNIITAAMVKLLTETQLCTRTSIMAFYVHLLLYNVAHLL